MSRPALILTLAWVLAMISLPIQRWLFGDAIIPAGVTLAVVLQASAVLALLTHRWGVARTIRTATLVVILAWLVEAVGSRSGLPFGEYTYTARLQPQALGVPLLIPLAWLMMLPPAWAVGRVLAGRYRTAGFVLISTLAFTAWDLFLDPQMVMGDFWQWQEPGGYFGIPWLNFGGWLLASALLTFLIRPDDLPIVPLFAVYAITWALETIGLVVFWQLPGPGLVGGTVMGIFTVATFLKLRTKS
ncbi:MAG: carotenoid biosynthesis protein [Caldilineales bacterium]|nr:carotenoid biosynthesis protein [Caldilineales bacterium]